jgi:hypothetical protein
MAPRKQMRRRDGALLPRSWASHRDLVGEARSHADAITRIIVVGKM